MSYSDCEHEMNNSNYIHMSKLEKVEKKSNWIVLFSPVVSF